MFEDTSMGVTVSFLVLRLVVLCLVVVTGEFGCNMERDMAGVSYQQRHSLRTLLRAKYSEVYENTKTSFTSPTFALDLTTSLERALRNQLAGGLSFVAHQLKTCFRNSIVTDGQIMPCFGEP